MVRKHIVLAQHGWAKEVNVPAISKTIKSADWKTEKHVPVIELPPTIQAGEDFQVKVSLGEGVPHPNTTEHHIRWISVYFQPEGAPVHTASRHPGRTRGRCTLPQASSSRSAQTSPAYCRPSPTAISTACGKARQRSASRSRVAGPGPGAGARDGKVAARRVEIGETNGQTRTDRHAQPRSGG
jgi:superoxide reductase